jgi:hypothetical protein
MSQTNGKGANPTNVIFNVSAVKIYNATSSLLRVEIKSTFFCLIRKTLLPTTTLALYKVVNSKVVGLAPGTNPTIASYNASVVIFYNATGSLVHFKKNMLIKKTL